MSDKECVNTKVLVKVAPLPSEAVNALDFVNVLDSVNVFENVFDFVNVLENVKVSVMGRYSSIVVPLETFKFPNVSL